MHENLQGFPGATAKGGKKFSIIQKVPAENLRDAENEMTMGHLFEDIHAEPFAEFQSSCKNKQIRNHVIKIDFRPNNVIHIEGMLYSQYGWVMDLSNKMPIEIQELRLENPISHMDAPEILKDLSLSHDRVCILNPDFRGLQPDLPIHWKNKEN